MKIPQDKRLGGLIRDRKLLNQFDFRLFSSIVNRGLRNFVLFLNRSIDYCLKSLVIFFAHKSVEHQITRKSIAGVCKWLIHLVGIITSLSVHCWKNEQLFYINIITQQIFEGDNSRVAAEAQHILNRNDTFFYYTINLHKIQIFQSIKEKIVPFFLFFKL